VGEAQMGKRLSSPGYITSQVGRKGDKKTGVLDGTRVAGVEEGEYSISFNGGI